MDNNDICEYSGLPSTQSYVTNPQAEGAGVGGESIKENFIDSASASVDSVDKESEQQDKLDKIYEKLDIDFMYNWIRKHSGK
jgi:hypothetical protein